MFGFSKRDEAVEAVVVGARKTSTKKRVITFASAAAVIAAGVTTVGAVGPSAAQATTQPGDQAEATNTAFTSPYVFSLAKGTGTAGDFDIISLNIESSIDGFAAYCVEPFVDSAAQGQFTILKSETAQLTAGNKSKFTPTLQQWSLLTALLNSGPSTPINTATPDQQLEMLAKQAVIWTVTEHPEMLSTPEGIAQIQAAITFNGANGKEQQIRDNVKTLAENAWNYWANTIKPVFEDKSAPAGTGIFATEAAAQAKPVTITDFPQGTSIDLGLGANTAADGSTLTDGLALSADGKQITIPAAAPAGTYKIRVGIAAPALWSYNQNKDMQIVATPKGQTINYIDQFITINRAAPAAKASLGDYVWKDTNKNGQQDADEAGVAGVTVNLLDKDGNVVKTVTTDDKGKYLFTDLDAGDYSVEFKAPDALTFTTANTGDDASDSDADVATGKTTPVTLKAGDNNLTVDAGLVDKDATPPVTTPPTTTPDAPKASMGDYVWFDTNKDGIQDADEKPAPGVTVKLVDGNGDVIKETKTDENGKYLFDNLDAGKYGVLVEKPAGTEFTKQNAGTPGNDSAVNVDTGRSGIWDLAPGQQVLVKDAGLIAQPASMGDYVWFDANKDGIQGADEKPAPGVTVKLVDGNGNVIAETKTDENGKYLFDNLTPGKYGVLVEKPAGTEFTKQDAGTPGTDSAVNVDTGRSGIWDLAPGQQVLVKDAGLIELPAALGDYVWFDTNKDGIQDADEKPVANVVVNLLDASGKKVAETKTDENGKYLFDNLAAGTYSVQFVAPAGTGLTKANAGDDAKDSDADVATGTTGQYTLAAGEKNLTVDAGLVDLPAALGDYVWLDANKNGVQDADEKPVADVVVNLLDASGKKVAETKTDANGKYIFENLAAGDYSVEFVAPAGLELTTANAGTDDATDSDANKATGKTDVYTLKAGDRNLTVDAGLFVKPASLGDTVWLDNNKNGQQDAGEPGVKDVTVNLLDKDGKVVATTKTDNDGKYIFDELAPGDYSVQFVAPEKTKFTIANTGDDASDSDADVTTGKTATVTLTAGDNNLTVDAGLVPLPAALGDYVWEDTNGNGLQDAGEKPVADVEVTLLDKDGKAVKTVKTDAEGKYLFTDLEAGTYSVQFTAPAGSKLTTANAGDDALDSDADATTGKTGQYTLAAGDTNLTVDAGIIKPATVGDFVWEDTNGNGQQDAGEPGVKDVTVNLLDKDGKVVATTKTDNDGKYLFENVTPGTYTVEFVAPNGKNFTTVDQGDDAKDSDANQATGKTTPIVVNSGDKNLTIDAGLVSSAALGDTVWNDLNADGLQEAGEPGVKDVTVNLLDKDGKVVKTVTTDAEGKYIFTDLQPGDYSVQFTAPAGAKFTKADAGDDTKDSDADVTTGKTAVVSLKSGDRNLTVDAGIVIPAKIGDTVWSDDNGNGQQDKGEPGIVNVTVNLIDEAGKVVKTTTTDKDGKYEFTDVPPGTFVVQVIPPKDRPFTTPDKGDDTTDSDINPGTGKTTAIVVKSGDDNNTIDAGILPIPAKIGDKVWNDDNANGVQDDNEKGVPNVTVNLIDNGGKVVSTTKTNDAGEYIFDKVLPGTYVVEFVATPGTQFTTPNTGTDTSKDSNVNVSTGRTEPITVKPGDVNLTIDAGLVTPELTTVATDTNDGDKMINEGSSLTDTITFKGLTPGVEYIVSGELFDKATGKSAGITSAARFTPSSANGTTKLAFELPEAARGLTLVAFETVYKAADVTVADGAVKVTEGKTPVAIHHDINDAAQTVTVPKLDTVATDASDKDKVVNVGAEGAQSVNDTVTYRGLTAGQEYTLAAVLTDKATGKTVAGSQAVAKFTPPTADGTVDIKVPVPAAVGGKATLVVFQELFLSTDVDVNGVTVTAKAGKTPVAVHKDINSAAQTITTVDEGTGGKVITNPPVTPPVTTPGTPVTPPVTTPGTPVTPPVTTPGTPGTSEVPPTPAQPTAPTYVAPPAPQTPRPTTTIDSGTLPNTLARTGTDGLAMGLTVAMLLAAGGALVVAGRRRKSEKDA